MNAAGFRLVIALAVSLGGTAGGTAAVLTPLTTDASGNPILHPTDLTTVPGAVMAVPYGMVYVPGATFTYGTGGTAETVTLGPYCIGKYEVTNAEYRAFLQATGSTDYPRHWTNGTYPEGKANHPVLYVSLTAAQAYCRWVSTATGWDVAIPTAYQWERAARGPEGWLYPWGNTTGTSYDRTSGVLTSRYNYNAVVAAFYLNRFPDLAVTYTDSRSPYVGRSTTVQGIAAYDTTGAATAFALSTTGNVSGWVNHDTYTGFIYTSLYDVIMETGGNTTPVGTYPNGVSAYGCFDLAGNVFEWTTTTITATNGAESGQTSTEIRGGSWYSTGTSGRSISIGEGRSPSGAYHSVGFRIVRNLPGSATGPAGTTDSATTTASSSTATTTASSSTTTSSTATTTTAGSSATTISASSGGGGGGGAPSTTLLAALAALAVSRRFRAGSPPAGH